MIVLDRYRLMFVCVLLGALSACSDQKPVDRRNASESQDSGTGATTPSVTALARSHDSEIRLQVDDQHILTNVGKKVSGPALVTSGAAGFLMFGPYLPLPAGNYKAKIIGRLNAEFGGGIAIDVADLKGTEILARKTLKVAEGPILSGDRQILASLDFTMTRDTTDLEIRVGVPANASMAITALEVLQQN